MQFCQTVKREESPSVPPGVVARIGFLGSLLVTVVYFGTIQRHVLQPQNLTTLAAVFRIIRISIGKCVCLSSSLSISIYCRWDGHQPEAASASTFITIIAISLPHHHSGIPPLRSRHRHQRLHLHQHCRRLRRRKPGSP